ncbi:hypothetical protein [Planctobacterium marinum]|uniref:Uncharacterized protein n=1 Tax=Planctobacterium marinum TaxID=1631968 RepID=A0AA48KTE3_9ALTE|nr:hypothetical protein MACH26_36230 [Planctobacterium marinum]
MLRFVTFRTLILLPTATLLSVLSFSSLALPETCIQDPQRRDQCPRIIYKNATLPDPQTGEDKTQLVCICLTDFKDLLLEEKDEVAKQIKQMRINSWTAQLGITEEQLKELVKY